MGHVALELKHPGTNTAWSPIGFDFDDQLMADAAMTETDSSIDLEVVRDQVSILHRLDLNTGNILKQFADSIYG